MLFGQVAHDRQVFSHFYRLAIISLVDDVRQVGIEQTWSGIKKEISLLALQLA